MLTSALRSGGLSTTSVAEATPSRSPGVSSTAFRAQSPNLRFASLMDMDFAVSCPLVRRWRLISGFCSSTRTFVPCFLQPPPRGGSPCIITRPYLHQVGQRTFTSKLLSMPSSERSRWCGGRYRVGEVGSRGVHRPINCGSQGGPCDPSTQNHAGGTPASSLLAGYHTTLHPLRRKIRTTLPLCSGPPGSAAHSGVPGPTLHSAEAVARYGDKPSVCPTVFLHPDTEEAVEHCRHALSQETPPSAHHSQSGRGSATHRRRSDCLYRTVLMTLYATGIRNAELTRLKISDVDSQRMV